MRDLPHRLTFVESCRIPDDCAVLVAWPSGGGQGQIALASAIDSRGYFLTAAHCARESDLYLGYMDSSGTKLARARVVAMPADPDRDDFALIAVGAKVPYAFAWSDAREFAPNQAAAAVGLNFPGNRSGARALGLPTCVAGRVLSVQPMGKLAVRIRHNLPLRPGDSGGPLVWPDGKLIGVNTGAARGASLAIRPDLTWIAKKISDDLRRQAP
ncbi:MAG TPA: trypsin-like peptidase domain-containing protein [Tepidisphaeraceae bacterium]|nr:trypsin-like peptidase domain-containing protein [Tepidisphaeraceae bacterium]